MTRILQQLSLLILPIFLLPGLALASTLQVGSGQTYTTIGACITAASASDVCNVHSGTYSEDVTISKAITVQNNTGDSPAITGLVDITSSTATFKGFDVSKVGCSTYLIHADGRTALTIQLNVVHGCSASGGNAIYVRNSTNSLIDQNETTGSDVGIQVISSHSTDATYAHGIQITNNFVHDNITDGAELHGQYLTVSGNRIYDNITTAYLTTHPDGIQLLAAGPVDGFTSVQHAKIYNNQIRNHTQNIFSEGKSCDQASDTQDIQIFNNSIYNTLATVNGVNMATLGGVNLMIKCSRDVFAVNNTLGDIGTSGNSIHVQSSYDGSIHVKNNIETNSVSNGIYVEDTNDIASGELNANRYNITNGSASAVVWGSNFYATLAAFKAAVPAQEVNGTSGNPLINAFPTPTLQATSPVSGSGLNLTSLGIAALGFDKANIARPPVSNWAAGAYQLTASSCVLPVISSQTATSASDGLSFDINFTTNVPTNASALVNSAVAAFYLQTSISDTAGTTSHTIHIPGTVPGVPGVLTYSWGVQAQPIVSGVACPNQYWINYGGVVGGAVITTASPPAGAFDYWTKINGPTHVAQGQDIYVQFANGTLTGSFVNTNSVKAVISGLPTFTTVQWWENQILSQPGTRSTTTVANDTLTYYTFNSRTIHLTTSVGGTTPLGTYPITITTSGVGAGGASVPTHTATMNLVVEQYPFGVNFVAGTPGSYPTIPNLTDWTNNALTYGTYNCAEDTVFPRTIRANDEAHLTPVGLTSLGAWYYDGLFGYWNVSDILGDVMTWAVCRDNIKDVWRDKYIIANHGNVQPILMFAHGLYEDYIRTGDAADLTALDYEAQHPYISAGGGNVGIAALQRETAYGINLTLYETVLGRSQSVSGQPSSYWVDYFETMTLGQLDTYCHSLNAQYYEFFMMGIQMESLIEYYEKRRADPRIPAAVKCTIDKMWTDGWNAITADPGAFPYDRQWLEWNLKGSSATQLNLLIATAYAWYFKMSGDDTYRIEGDQIWQHGVLLDGAGGGPGGMGPLNPVPGGNAGKNFSQNYKWSKKYVDYRSAPTVAASIAPASVAFGNQKTSVTSSAQTVTLTNVGTGTMNLTSELLTTHTQFAISNNTCSSTLAAAASCVVSLTCTPTGTGLQQDTLTFVNDGPTSPQQIGLSCTGTASSVNLSPTSLAFGSQLDGTSSATRVATLTNTGSATLGGMSNAITGTNANQFSKTTTCVTTLTASSNCTTTVTFSPTSAGAKSASISYTNDASDSPQSVALTGTGFDGGVQIDPLSLNFGSKFLTQSRTLPITLTNNGAVPLLISPIDITGSDADQYSQTNNCGSSLATTASCTINVTFTPTSIGSKAGTLRIFDNAADSPQQNVLSGVGATIVDATQLKGVTAIGVTAK